MLVLALGGYSRLVLVGTYHHRNLKPIVPIFQEKVTHSYCNWPYSVLNLSQFLAQILKNFENLTHSYTKFGILLYQEADFATHVGSTSPVGPFFAKYPPWGASSCSEPQLEFKQQSSSSRRSQGVGLAFGSVAQLRLIINCYISEYVCHFMVQGNWLRMLVPNLSAHRSALFGLGTNLHNIWLGWHSSPSLISPL